MSDEKVSCEQIGQWLAEQRSAEMPLEWSGHLENCSECREQMLTHQSLVVAFADEVVPELSTNFDAGLERKLAAAGLEIRPLAGWRKAAMMAYGAAAVGILGWALRDVPLPTIDLSAPWVPVAVFVAVPLTLLLAVAASRWLPAPGPKLGPPALGL